MKITVPRGESSLSEGLTSLYPLQQALSVTHSTPRAAAQGLPWFLISLHDMSKARTVIVGPQIQIPKGSMCAAVCVRVPSLLWQAVVGQTR